MSIETLTGLRDYLYITLSPANMLWLGKQLTEYAIRKEEELKPYTKEELQARIEEHERQMAAGDYMTSEELFSRLNKEFHFLDEEEENLEIQLEKAV